MGINCNSKEMCGNEGVLVLVTPSVGGCWFGWIDVERGWLLFWPAILRIPFDIGVARLWPS